MFGGDHIKRNQAITNKKTENIIQWPKVLKPNLKKKEKSNKKRI
jgi:hypothetical protein